MTKKIDCSPDTKEYASFLRVKKIKGNLYLYEVTPSYNPVTKKRSQTSKYIRKVYPHEDLHNITRDPPPVPVEPPKLKEVKAFGDAYVFHSLVQEIGLEKVLLKCFSQEDAHFLLLLTAYRLLCGDSLCHLSSWMETSDLLSFYPYEQSLSSSSISKTLQRIGCSIDEQSSHFFLHWSQKINREGESLLFDLTSFSSQAHKMEELEMDSKIIEFYSRFAEQYIIENKDMVYCVANILMKDRNYDEAELLFTHITESESIYADSSIIQLGIIFTHNHELVKLDKIMSELSPENGVYPYLLRNRGEIYHYNRDFERAVNEFLQSAELFGENRNEAALSLIMAAESALEHKDIEYCSILLQRASVLATDTEIVNKIKVMDDKIK